MRQTPDDHIDSISGIIRFDSTTYGYLSSVLGRFHADDPYLTCPAYHAITGRFGLWGYARNGAFLLFSKHPNVKNEIIFFPQLGTPFPNLALDIIHELKDTNLSFSFARIPEEKTEFFSASMNKACRNLFFLPQEEAVLDWKYPVHTISTHDVSRSNGRNFKAFRCDLNAVNTKRIRIEPLDILRDKQALSEIVAMWSKQKNSGQKICEDNFYSFVLNNLNHPALNLSGIKFFWDNQPVAFEIWSIPNKNTPLANSLVGLNMSHLYELDGFSSYQHYTICQLLKEKGIERVCLGGSETEGLDRFKRKMSPIRSIQLKSISVRSKVDQSAVWA